MLAAYRFAGYRWLLDVGGGEGAFLMRAAERSRSLRLMLFDLPPVAPGRDAFWQAGLVGAARAIGGSFLDRRAADRGGRRLAGPGRPRP